MKIAVLALQGAFAEHVRALELLDAEAYEIRQLEDFTAQKWNGLVIPGGESTVMGKLLDDLGLSGPIADALRYGLPVLGTCAGLILLSKSILRHNQALADTASQKEYYFPVLDATVQRNAYGRQLGSFQVVEKFRTTKGEVPIPMVFIRGPVIAEVGAGVEILARVDDRVVAVRQGAVMATAFHPELTDDLTVHQEFIANIKHHQVNK
ncbi:MAG: pyridoxal 5'-phosphate synthase glutaminase subunit PdxT [Candidatus Ancillula trichonymphae]|nr:pyridoxal 5'-phosphate synthase glutaminase subunit PdxT [Candidatus Ancillula trichonymphae]